jgi:hypothetical protein
MSCMHWTKLCRCEEQSCTSISFSKKADTRPVCVTLTCAKAAAFLSARCHKVAAAALRSVGLLLLSVSSSSGRCLVGGTAPGAKRISCCAKSTCSSSEQVAASPRRPSTPPTKVLWWDRPLAAPCMLLLSSDAPDLAAAAKAADKLPAAVAAMRYQHSLCCWDNTQVSPQTQAT